MVYNSTMNLLQNSHPYKAIYNNILVSIESKSMNQDYILVAIPFIYKYNKGEFYNYKQCLGFCLKTLRENNYTAVYKKPNYIIIGNLHNTFDTLLKKCSRAREPSILKRQYDYLLEERDHQIGLINIKQNKERAMLGVTEPVKKVQLPEKKIISKDFYKTLGINNNKQQIDLSSKIQYNNTEPICKKPKVNSNVKKNNDKTVKINDINLLNIVSKNKRYSL